VIPRTPSPRWIGVVAAATWLATTAAMQWSVVRFRLLILLVLTAAAVVLAVSLARRVVPDPAQRWVPVTLAGSAVVTLAVPLFTYLRDGWLTAAVTVTVGAAVVTAVLTWLTTLPSDAAGPGPAAYLWGAVVGTAAVAAIALSTIAIIGDPAPRIDVWYLLQQASEVLGRGGNFYTATWTGSPGVKDIHSYLPWMTVLVAPGKWLFGDVRWALLLWSLVLLLATVALARLSATDGLGNRRGAAIAALLVVVPGTITQVDQAWTEPLLAALIVVWAVLIARGRAWWSIIPLALACASKQHLALVVPLLLVWRPFGWRRVLATGALTAALISPWVLADFAAFWHDTVTALVQFHPIRFANTWFLFFLNEFGITLPFWVTGLVVLGALAHRDGGRPSPATRSRRIAALGGPLAPGRQPREQAGLLQPILAVAGARRRLARHPSSASSCSRACQSLSSCARVVPRTLTRARSAAASASACVPGIAAALMNSRTASTPWRSTSRVTSTQLRW
jgi:hypothetical protein